MKVKGNKIGTFNHKIYATIGGNVKSTARVVELKISVEADPTQVTVNFDSKSSNLTSSTFLPGDSLSWPLFSFEMSDTWPENACQLRYTISGSGSPFAQIIDGVLYFAPPISKKLNQGYHLTISA